MASQLGNTIYLDSSSDSGFTTSNKVRLKRIVLTATSSNGTIAIKDNGQDSLMIDVREPTSGVTRDIDLGRTPILIPNGIKLGTLSNCVVTLILEDEG